MDDWFIDYSIRLLFKYFNLILFASLLLCERRIGQFTLYLTVQEIDQNKGQGKEGALLPDWKGEEFTGLNRNWWLSCKYRWESSKELRRMNLQSFLVYEVREREKPAAFQSCWLYCSIREGSWINRFRSSAVQPPGDWAHPAGQFLPFPHHRRLLSCFFVLRFRILVLFDLLVNLLNLGGGNQREWCPSLGLHQV